MPRSSSVSSYSSRNPSQSAAPSRARSSSVGEELEELDRILAKAGLSRSGRKTRAAVSRETKAQLHTPDELRPAPARTIATANGVEYVTVPGWEKIDWLWHGFSTRRGGVSTAYAAEGAPGELNIGFTAEDGRENVLENRRRLAEAVTGNQETPLVMLRQVHSSVLVLAGEAVPGQPCKGDGLLSEQPGILIGVQTADCIPVLVADRKRKVVGAFHAGWRGTVKRIVESGIGRMQLEFGCRPEDMVAAIGPGIGPCCYAVGDEVVSEFESQFAYGPELFREVSETDPARAKYSMMFLNQRAPGHSPLGPKHHLDLIEANRQQLLAAGLKAKTIQAVGGCTNCQRELFFSYRAAQGRTGRMVSVIGIRN